MKQREANAGDELRALVAREGSQAAAAKHLAVSEVYVSDLLRGRRPFSESILAKLGLRRAVVKQ